MKPPRPPHDIIKIMVYCRKLIWALRIRKILKMTEGSEHSYGQFLSVLGYYIANKKLPQTILQRLGLKL